MSYVEEIDRLTQALAAERADHELTQWRLDETLARLADCTDSDV